MTLRNPSRRWLFGRIKRVEVSVVFFAFGTARALDPGGWGYLKAYHKISRGYRFRVQGFRVSSLEL